MPAAAVIPALIAYFNVVAVKKLVVGFRVLAERSTGMVSHRSVGLLSSAGASPSATSTGYPTLYLTGRG